MALGMSPQRLQSLYKLGAGAASAVPRQQLQRLSVPLGVVSMRWASTGRAPRADRMEKPGESDNLERPSASEIWTARNSPDHASSTGAPEKDADALLQGSLYTPRSKLDISLGPLAFPLKWPEYDQGLKPNGGLPHIGTPPGYDPATFDAPDNPPPGGYPNIPHQWTQLKDPYKYWDQQGRRTYGDVLHRYDNLTDEWGIGPNVSPWFGLKKSAQAALLIGVVTFGVALWSPEDNLWFAPKDFPYNGLRVELGGDPNDETKGNSIRARKYQDHFDPNYKAL
ncbi:hypothetical protein HDU67_002485 [Dinochytrium kinnereticum]|nr:hypothetical protein HDU67_002485 [Dinochytrium kinnereticum]